MQYYIGIPTLLLFGTIFALVFHCLHLTKHKMAITMKKNTLLGPMATSLLAHHNLQANIQSNTGGLACASNQIGFLRDNNLFQRQCGQCKPGTHGNWRIHV